jgi:hypothetical protein
VSIFRKANKRASSRRQIDIKGVKDGLLMLPGNRYVAVIEVSSVNFELKSEDEQDALIDTYESFLNSLACPLQIIVRIRELDMDRYLTDLDARLANEQEDVYRAQLANYTEFVQGLVADNKILSRHFYVVLPFAARDGVDFATAKEQLTINSDIVCKGLMRLGMQTRQLGSLEVLDLFHSFYNPGQAKRQPISERVARLLNSSYIQGEKA